MADAGSDLAKDVLGQLLELRIQGGFQRRARLHVDLEEDPAAAVGQGLDRSSAVRPASARGHWMPSVAAQLRVVLLLQAAGAGGVAGFERAAGFLDLLGVRLGRRCPAGRGRRCGWAPAAGSRGMARAPGIAAICSSVMVRPLLAQGDGGDEGLRRRPPGPAGRTPPGPPPPAGRAGWRTSAGSAAAQQRLVDAHVHHRPVGDQLGVTGAQDVGPRRRLGSKVPRISPSARSGTRQRRVPDRQPLVAGLLQLGGDGVLPLSGADLPAVVQRDRGRIGLQRHLAAFHRGLVRAQCPEYLLELLVGRAWVLAVKGDGADVERRDSGRQLLRGVLRAGPAVVAGHQRAAKNKTDKDS